jgi:hypothetical protein
VSGRAGLERNDDLARLGVERERRGGDGDTAERGG